MSFNRELFKNKILYRASYRGTKEMDKLIGTFVKQNINTLNSHELLDLEKFLEIDDDILYKFYNGEITETNIGENKIISLFKNYTYK